MQLRMTRGCTLPREYDASQVSLRLQREHPVYAILSTNSGKLSFRSERMALETIADLRRANPTTDSSPQPKPCMFDKWPPCKIAGARCSLSLPCGF